LEEHAGGRCRWQVVPVAIDQQAASLSAPSEVAKLPAREKALAELRTGARYPDHGLGWNTAVVVAWLRAQ
jgi:hypothetical protein